MAKQPPPETLDHLPRLPRRNDRAIGCIGAGFIMADCHLVAYRQAGFRVESIASRRIERAREVAERHAIPRTAKHWRELIEDRSLQVLNVAVPPDRQGAILREIARRGRHLEGVLAQKPLASDHAEAADIVRRFRRAGIRLSVNQNMRFDPSVRACADLLQRGRLGDPVFASIDMRAIPHWMPWQKRQGWVTLRIMSIHHLDTFRYWFGDPVRVYASVRPDPRTERSFRHRDGICLYVLEFADGSRASAWDDVWTGPAREGAASDIGIRWRVEGTRGLALGEIGWPKYPARTPSTIDYTTIDDGDRWFRPRWDAVWFPDAFSGPMGELLLSIEEDRPSAIDARDNLLTMALVDACYVSAREHRAVPIREILRRRKE